MSVLLIMVKKTLLSVYCWYRIQTKFFFIFAVPNGSQISTQWFGDLWFMDLLLPKTASVNKPFRSGSRSATTTRL